MTDGNDDRSADEWQARFLGMQQERDAAIIRAEAAERERNKWREGADTLLEALRRPAAFLEDRASSDDHYDAIAEVAFARAVYMRLKDGEK